MWLIIKDIDNQFINLEKYIESLIFFKEIKFIINKLL